MKTQLLCTFTKSNSLTRCVDKIIETYDVLYNKIFVLNNEGNKTELMCTYNVDSTNAIDYNSVDSTISLHRKKFTNTLYTINGLNEVIASLNNGLMDSKFIVPWDDFKNTLLITNNEGLKRINTRIFKIVKTEEL